MKLSEIRGMLYFLTQFHNTINIMNFSIIIPVYNRPDEVEELLDSLSKQSETNFEIIIVEDGSVNKCFEIVEKYRKKLNIKYYDKKNEGPGLSRNFGADRANYEYFIFFDSDCIIPNDYFKIVNKYLNTNYVDSFGGPDASHKSFSSVQKAINYSMTSFFTTGGIRGGKTKVDKFHPRSFNMGFSSEVYKKTNGFSKMRFGEDIDMSLRIINNDFSTTLIREAFVYHKRRTDFRKFFKQVHNSGIARINLYKRHPKSLKIVHTFPSAFLIGNIFILIISIVFPIFSLLIVFYTMLLFTDSLIKNKNIVVAILSIVAAYTQLFGYGSGFIISVWKRIILNKQEFNAFNKNFYK